MHCVPSQQTVPACTVREKNKRHRTQGEKGQAGPLLTLYSAPLENRLHIALGPALLEGLE